MIKYIFIIIFATIGLSVLANDVRQPEVIQKIVPKTVAVEGIDGFYQITGQMGDKRYVGMMTIKKPEGTSVYVVRSVIGSEVTKGVGILQNNTFSVSSTTGESQSILIMVFRNKDAEGVWTSIPGNGQLNRETWKFLGEYPNNE